MTQIGINQYHYAKVKLYDDHFMRPNICVTKVYNRFT